MGLLSLPTMLKRGYAPALATGIITASGTLGQIIPPSIVLVLLGDAIGSSFQAAQREMGAFSPETVSVGHLFAGALAPGLLLVAAYTAYMIAVAVFRPADAPATPEDERAGAGLARVVQALFAPLVLIVAVLGSILGGIATPTEAAAIGAVGALFLAGSRRADPRASGRATLTLTYLGAAAIVGLVALTSLADLRLGRSAPSAGDQAGVLAAFALCAVASLGIAAALHRLWPSRVVHDVTRDTANITAMVFVILIGATLFSLVFRGLGGDELVENLLRSSTDGLIGVIEGGLRLVGLEKTAAAFDASDAAIAAVGVAIVML